jgi:hypothetical protein
MTLTAKKYGFFASFHREQMFFGKTILGFEAKLNIFKNSIKICV